MANFLYYTAPPDEIFEEVKAKAIEIWRKYDNTFGYVDEKLKQINPMTNYEDNFMYIVAMFDINNQIELANKIGENAKKEIRDRMIDGGMPDEYIVF